MSTANVTFQKGFRKAVFKGMVVGVAMAGTSFVSVYAANPMVTQAAETPSRQNVSFIKKTSMAYTERKPFIVTVASKGAKKVSENIDANNNISSEPVIIPVKYGGKLTVGPEDNYTINNDREFVNMSHKVETVSIPVRYGGRLSVGRER